MEKRLSFKSGILEEKKDLEFQIMVSSRRTSLRLKQKEILENENTDN